MTLMPRSIRGRMLALSAVTTLIALIAAGLMITSVLEHIVTQGIDHRLDAEIALLASSVDKDGRIDEQRLAGVRDALDAGPGWQWRIATAERSIGSADFPELDEAPQWIGRRKHHERHGPEPREGHDRDGFPVHARRVTLATPLGEAVLTATAPRAVIERPIRAATIPLLILLAVLSALLAGASILQVRYGLRPLRDLRRAVADIRAGRARAVPDRQPDELRPLAEELNALAAENEAALAAARASAANLAHALKTPVATLALELRGDPEAARQVARIDATIRHHLSRARDRVARTRVRTPISPAIADLVATIARLTDGRAIAIDMTVDPAAAVAVDPADFDELMGNLIDNAVRHARQRVAIRAEAVGGAIRIGIDDDGPGIPAEARARAMQPGVRLDERGEGHGFGLAIARELAELYGGTIMLDQAAMGGLAVILHLPPASA
jgi:signal transduction histidine kinase